MSAFAFLPDGPSLRRRTSPWLPVLLGLVSLGGSPMAHGAIMPPSAGYGAAGSFGVETQSFVSPLNRSQDVTVYLPTGSSGRVPVLFFAHGFDGEELEGYDALMRHEASRGYAVVFAPYTNLGSDQLLRYAQMFSGYKEAVRRFADRLDTTRVGFFGHSLGGGAVPTLARQGLVNEHWGSNGAFLYSMAPWYTYGLSPQELRSFPAHTKMIMEIYADDTINDHRMAIDIFKNINIPNSEKDFLTVYSDSHRGESLVADHFTPGSLTNNALDYYGIYKPLDALADYAFTGSLAAKSVALGGGTSAQTYMGKFDDGTPVRRMSVTDNPVTLRSQSSFVFPFTSPFNPRVLAGPSQLFGAESSQLVAVPEPSTQALASAAGAVGACLAWARRRRRQA
ncbi:MAG: hypothetical protein K1X74_22235 [Pirellulales bacterium]|nr:hypothetical protein [Pirellulales bacterium]